MDNSVEFIVSSVWLILFMIVMVGVFINVKLVNKYIKSLQSNFPNSWKDIHEVGAMTGEIKTQLNFLKFLYRRDYQSLEDPTVINDGKKLRKFFLFYCFLCGCFFVMTLILLA